MSAAATAVIYGSQAASVLYYKAQVLPLPESVLREERVILHKLLHLPDKVFKGFPFQAIHEFCGIRFVSLSGVGVASKLRLRMLHVALMVLLHPGFGTLRP
eukprot:5373944-Karenia_brevis.AAC.1